MRPFQHKIKIQITEHEVIIETSNSISSSEKYTNTGIGKDNLERLRSDL
jgi:uncharacterized protein YbcI